VYENVDDVKHQRRHIQLSIHGEMILLILYS
jgi:hypothetical protein